VTISPDKIFYGEEHCAIFIIRVHFMWGLQLGLGIIWGVRVRITIR